MFVMVLLLSEETVGLDRGIGEVEGAVAEAVSERHMDLPRKVGELPCCGEVQCLEANLVIALIGR